MIPMVSVQELLMGTNYRWTDVPLFVSDHAQERWLERCNEYDQRPDGRSLVDHMISRVRKSQRIANSYVAESTLSSYLVRARWDKTSEQWSTVESNGSVFAFLLRADLSGPQGPQVVIKTVFRAHCKICDKHLCRCESKDRDEFISRGRPPKLYNVLDSEQVCDNELTTWVSGLRGDQAKRLVLLFARRLRKSTARGEHENGKPETD